MEELRLLARSHVVRGQVRLAADVVVRADEDQVVGIVEEVRAQLIGETPAARV